MALTPIPLTTDGSGPSGAIPVDISGPVGTVDPVIAALIAAGFGQPGQRLTMNSAGDGFVWVLPTSGT